MGDRRQAWWTPWRVALALLATATAAPASDCTLFVRAGHVPAAGETADGRSPARAFDRIAAAAAAIINAGEVVCVGPGIYEEGNLSPAIDGTAILPIVFRAVPDGTATGDAAGAVRLVAPAQEPPVTAGFRFLGRRYLHVEGFHIRGFMDAGVQVRAPATGSGNSSDITVRGNVIEACGSGVDISGEGRFVIEGNDLINNGSVGIGVRDCPESDIVDPRCRGGVSKPVQPVLSNNRVFYNVQHGVFISGAVTATVQNTVGFGNFTGITVQSSSAVVLANNLLYGNASDGITAGAGGTTVTGLIVLNNTLYGNGAWGVRIGDNLSASTGARVFNNILVDNGSGGLAVARDATCGYAAGFNLLDGPTPYGPSTPSNTAYDLVRTNPHFVNPAGPDGVLGWRVMNGELVDFSADDDFRLQRMPTDNRTSPAIDAGFTTAVALGVLGSTARTTSDDAGPIDLGYHYGATPAQRIAAPLPEAFMPIYVRSSGADRQAGTQPGTAKATLTQAAKLAVAGVTVVVGPGQYADANVGPPQYGGRATFRADASGSLTGDLPGPVLLDPALLRPGADKSTGFLAVQACDVVIDGFHVRNAADAGIQIRTGSRRAIVRNNVVFTNSRGIDAVDADDVQIVNNLVYDNDTGGIQIGGNTTGSRRAVLRNNTAYANVGGNGISIGVGTGASTGARLEYNLSVANGGNGVNARGSYTGQYNLFFGNGISTFGGVAQRQTGDRIDINPLFVNPAGPDARLGGAHFQDDSFLLSQVMAGQAVTSPAVDGGPVTAESAGMHGGTTSSNGTPDEGAVDLGFHYRATPAVTLYVATDGDDAHDGRLEAMPLRTIREALRRAVDGTLIRVAAGTYVEGGLSPGAGVTVAGVDPMRTHVVGTDASTVFDVQQPRVTLRRLAIRGARDVGVRGRADALRLIDTRILGNGGRGVVLLSGTGSLLFNNVVADNVSTGIVVGSATTAADLATVAHNTVVANGGLGITVGLDATVPSAGAAVVNNVIADNVRAGIGIGPASAATAQVGYNCNDDGYRDLERPPTDLIGDPRFVDAAGGDFRLVQLASGQPETSRCVDAGWRQAAQLGLADASTRTDGVGDLGVADIGYHYGLPINDDAVVALLRFAAPAGDCDGDGATLIHELVLAVNIALGTQPVGQCVVLDADGNGQVTINEIIAAVTGSLDS